MFNDLVSDGMAIAGGNPAAAQLSHAQVEPPAMRTGEGRYRIARITRFSERFEQWRRIASLKFHGLDLVPDLACDVGSRRWLRGLATLGALTATALSGWPDFAPVAAAPAMRVDDAVRDEFRSRTIAPLALGADSGRRMGATALVVPLQSAPERPQIDLEATLAQGDSFARMLQRAGAGGAEADLIQQMIAGAIPLADIAPGTTVDVTLGRRPAPGAPRPVDSLSFRARFDLQLAVERHGGRLQLAPRTIAVDSTPLRIRGTVGPSLYRSARSAGAPAEAVQQYLRTLGAEMGVDAGLQPGDEFDMVVEYRRAATGETETGKLQFAGLFRAGKPVKRLVRWGSEGRFFEASGVGETRQGMVAPVAGPISSGYGQRRHPILGYTRMHAGVDFRASYGQPIYAVADGTVSFAGRHGGHGNYVRLSHGNSLGTGYAHMSRIAVSPGMRVRSGQVIGYVGSTGLSTGPHLHYEVYRGGAAVNPMSLRFTMRAQLEGRELAAFRARLAELQAIKAGAALAPMAPPASAQTVPQREIDRLDGKKIGA